MRVRSPILKDLLQNGPPLALLEWTKHVCDFCCAICAISSVPEDKLACSCPKKSPIIGSFVDFIHFFVWMCTVYHRLAEYNVQLYMSTGFGCAIRLRSFTHPILFIHFHHWQWCYMASGEGWLHPNPPNIASSILKPFEPNVERVWFENYPANMGCTLTLGSLVLNALGRVTWFDSVLGILRFQGHNHTKCNGRKV